MECRVKVEMCLNGGLSLLGLHPTELYAMFLWGWQTHLFSPYKANVHCWMATIVLALTACLSKYRYDFYQCNSILSKFSALQRMTSITRITRHFLFQSTDSKPIVLKRFPVKISREKDSLIFHFKTVRSLLFETSKMFLEETRVLNHCIFCGER